MKYLIILPGLYEFSEDIYRETHEFENNQDLEAFRKELATRHGRYKGAVLAVPESRFHLLEEVEDD